MRAAYTAPEDNPFPHRAQSGRLAFPGEPRGVETLSVVDTVRRLSRAATANFAPYRGTNRLPNAEIVAEFELTFTVEGAADACVSLLDYDVPRVHITIYRGTSIRAAREAYRAYDELFRLAVGAAGARSEHTYEHQGDRSDTETVWYAGWNCGVHLWSSSRPNDAAPFEHSVTIEIPGTEVECIEGRPEDSVWHILFAGTPLHATDRTPREPPESPVRKPRDEIRDRNRKR